MPIQNSGMAIGASFTPTGGTETSLLSKGQSVNEHITMLDDGSAYKDQTMIDFSVKEPKISSSAPAGYTQARSSVVIRIPITLGNGARTVNTLRMELSADAETSSADLSTLREIGMHLLSDADFQNFWDDRALS